MQKNILYREMRDSEKNQVSALVKSGFDKFVLSDVTEEGAEEFFRAAREMIYERPAGHFILVAEAKNRIAGMIDVRNNNHICLFFVAKAFQRQGIGRGLLEQAIAACIRNDPTVAEIDVHSSLFAVQAYQRLGFIQSKPEQVVNGIRFAPMMKPLRKEASADCIGRRWMEGVFKK
jgi:GNAT superfamily N-acetyltransferase